MPDYVAPFILGLSVLLPVVLSIGLWFALLRSSLKSSDRFAVWAAFSGFLLAWLATAWTLGSAQLFLAEAELYPTIQFAIAAPIVLGLLLAFRSARFAAALDAVPQSWLTGVQLYRAIGAIFLVLWAGSLMPGAFALPAGIGDILVGLAAPVVAWLNIRAWRYADEATNAWNWAGLGDLVIAMAMGFTTAPSPLQIVALENPNTLISAFPLVMVPIFLVPTSIMLHVLSLWKLRRDRKSAVPALHQSSPALS